MRRLVPFLALCIGLGFPLQADEISVPIGVVYRNQDVFFDLEYHNRSAEPVRFKAFKASCDCVTVLEHPDTIAPGVAVKIHCVYRSDNAGSIRTVLEFFGDDADKLQASFVVTGFVAEQSWLTDARPLLSTNADQALLVDVRSAADYQRVHPLSAINLPLFSLKARPAYKARKLVLLDEGVSPDALLAEVLTLRKQGFRDVSVLKGGLAAWVRAGGMVVGEGKSALQLSLVDAAQFVRSRSSNPWLCLEVGAAGNPDPLRPAVTRVSGLAELEKKIAGKEWPVSGGAGFRPVLLIVSDAQSRAQIEKKFALGDRQIFYLNGTAETLANHEAAQLALSRHTEQTMTSRPSTSRVVSRPTASPGCGSCGSK